MVNHKKLDVSTKLEWLLNKNDIMNPILRHENFSLIQTIYPLLNNKQKIKLINSAEKESDKEYSIYNFVVWLNKSSPECTIALSKLNEIKKDNPDFEPRSNPDLGSYITSGWVGHVSPILVEDLLKMDLKDAIELLDTYKGEGGFNKPERQGLIDTLQDAIKQDSKWSLNIAEELADKEIWHKDVWSKVLYSWSEVKGLVDSDLKSIIMFLLKHKNLHVHHYEIARLLTANEESLFKTTKIESESTKLASEVMDVAFKDEDIGRVIISEDIPDWWSEAINSTGYYLCYFFVRLFDKKYKKSKSQISKLNELFLPFLKNNSYSAQMGKITLAHSLSTLLLFRSRWGMDKK